MIRDDAEDTRIGFVAVDQSEKIYSRFNNKSEVAQEVVL